jgi:hypothetical protein
LVQGNSYGRVVKDLPKELQKQADDILAGLNQMFANYKTQTYSTIQLMDQTIGKDASRKDKAEWLKVNSANLSLVFMALDNKDFDHAIWKLVLEDIKNEGSTIRN